jgi:hypothetical protein
MIRAGAIEEIDHLVGLEVLAETLEKASSGRGRQGGTRLPSQPSLSCARLAGTEQSDLTMHIISPFALEPLSFPPQTRLRFSNRLATLKARRRDS